MAFPDGLIPTPWDQNILGIPTWEVIRPDEEVLNEIGAYPGHYTVKTDPLASSAQLHRYGFYYCDTLIEPYVDRSRFVDCPHTQVVLDTAPDRSSILRISHGAFQYGRFYRDFNINLALADQRYDQWTSQLCDKGMVFGLLFEGKLAAFIGFSENRLVLHAVDAAFQGQGLSKYLWSRACSELFARGHDELCSSVSAANLAVVNLYASLGFRFRNPIAVYHRLVQ